MSAGLFGARIDGREARYLLPWNHAERWPKGSVDRVRPWILRLCRIDRITLKVLPPGPEREIVALQLRCRQRALARGWLSRRIFTYGRGKSPAQIRALHDELWRQGRAREADEATWRAIRARLDAESPDPLEVVRQRGRPSRPSRGVAR